MSDDLAEGANVLHTLVQQKLVEALDASRNRHALVLESLSEAVLELDASLQVTFANRAWTRLTGHTSEQTRSRALASFVVCEDQDAFAEVIEECARKGDGQSTQQSEHVELRLRRADGAPGWFRLGMSFRELDGAPMWFCTLHGIQARRELEASRDLQVRLFRAIDEAQGRFIREERVSGALEGLLTQLVVLSGAARAVLLCSGEEAEVPHAVAASTGESAGLPADVPALPSGWTFASLAPGETAGQAPEVLESQETSSGRAVRWMRVRAPHWSCDLHGPVVTVVLMLVGQPGEPLRASATELRPAVLAMGQMLEAEHARRERQVREAELDRLSQVAAQTTNGVILTGLEGRTQWVNAGFERMTGYGLEALRGRRPGELLQGPGTDEAAVERMREGLRSFRGFSEDVVNVDASGTPYWVRIQCNVLRNAAGEPTGFLAIQSDITQEHADAERLRASEREKSLLLREIHHRVKNNLQIMASMLMLQCRQVESEETASILMDSVRRTQAMALIHEQLYGSESLERVDLRRYMQRLLQSLRGAMAPRARFEVRGQGVVVPIQSAVSVGLILNELATNALKYGVVHDVEDDGGRTGPSVDVVCSVEEAEGVITCTVEDGGPGLPEGFDVGRSTGLGLRIVRTLVGQLRGTLSHDVDRGTRFTLRFPRPAALEAEPSP